MSLEALEVKCEAHVCVDLVDEKGRKPSGGKMEAVLRLREPLSGGKWEKGRREGGGIKRKEKGRRRERREKG